MHNKKKSVVKNAFNTLRQLLVYISILIIRVYQWTISPYLGKKCKHYPSCSHYSVEAFSKQGLVKGIILTLARIFRCNPWSLGGFDPVPEFVSFKKPESFKLSGNYQNQLYQTKE